MIRTWMFIFLFLFIAPINFSQTTYYISSSQGNDANSGTSETAPWKTIAKVNSWKFQPGDKILFKRGDKWAEQVSLVIKNSGISNNRITYAAYDEGDKPILSMEKEISGIWTNIYSNVWRKAIPNFFSGIRKLWLDDVSIKAIGYDDEVYSNPPKLAATANITNASQVQTLGSEYRFKTDPNSMDLYSVTEPSKTYASIKTVGDNDVIVLNNVDYVTIQDIKIQRCAVAILIQGSSHITIDSVDVYDVYYNAVRATKYGSTPSEYLEIKNCDFNSGFGDVDGVAYEYYFDRGNWALSLYDGLNYASIHNNTLTNWHHSAIFLVGNPTGGSYSTANFNEFYDNIIDFSGVNFGRALSINGNISSCHDNRFYRNKIIHQNIRSQVGGYHNYYYYNIIYKDTLRGYYNDGQENAWNWTNAMEGISGVSFDNYFFNNTIYTCKGQLVVDFGQRNHAFNNLIVNYHSASKWTLPVVDLKGSAGNTIYQNNLFYSPFVNHSTNEVRYNSNWGGTIADWNNQDLNGDVISGNKVLYSNPVISTTTFNVSGDALNGGIDISTLVPEGFLDRLGNVINRTKPDIGAVQSSVFKGDTARPTIIGAALIDSTKLLLTFSEPISPLGITSLQNYSITSGIIIYSAELNANPSKITLTTSSHNYNQNYSISIYNLQDLSGNVISSTNNSISYLSMFDRPSVGYMNKLSIIKAIASNTSDANTAPEKTIDGLYFSNGGYPDSRWAAMPCPQWLIYDLGVAKQISKMRISFYEYQNGRIYSYNISVSNDSVNWVTIVQNAASSNQEWTENIFNPIIARFVKLELISNNQVTWATVWETEIWGTSSLQPPIEVKSKIYLQGAYENNQMHTNLRISNFIPLSQPYNIAPWYYNGYETVSNIPAGVVDWALIELRSDSTAVSTVAQRAAFIRSDGSIIDLNGQEYINFYGISSGDYYVVIRHRNHLSIMSRDKATLTESPVLFDFTLSPSNVYGNDLVNLGDGKYGMYSGDGDANGTVNVLDYGTVGNKLFQTGYHPGDNDLNGVVNVLDYGKTNQNMLKVSNVP